LWTKADPAIPTILYAATGTAATSTAQLSRTPFT
jgi:hypothetical protein